LTKSINDSFLGFGTATSRIYKDIFSYELHNVYLTYLYEKGIVGFFFYIFFYFYTFFALFKKNFKIVSYEMAALLSLISNLFLFFFINVEVSPLLWILNAISVGILYKNK
jgi:O-antigen ligase